jgi:hypothetical protein
MWSLTSPRADRISGPEKFCSSARKDFFNSIGQERTSPTSFHHLVGATKQQHRDVDTLCLGGLEVDALCALGLVAATQISRRSITGLLSLFSLNLS